MLHVLLLSCLVAGGLSAKLSLGPEHRSAEGYGHGAAFQGSGSEVNPSRLPTTQNGNSRSFHSNSGTGTGFRQSGNVGGVSSSAFTTNGGRSPAFRQSEGQSSALRPNGGQSSAFRKSAGPSSAFGQNGGQSSAFGQNGGQSSAFRQNGGQSDDGLYRAEEHEAGQFDDGTWKPELYSGDDGLYRDEQYAPNTDASYQFQFDVEDHGRDEAADAEGQVQGSFYAVHPDGQRRDVEFTAGREGFVVTRDDSVQGPVPEYALRAAAKPRKEYPPAEIRTSLSPEGIYHWEYDAGDSSRSEDIDLNTNFYEGTFAFTADDDQNRYQVDYTAGAGIGFVPRGDHLPQQVEETPEVAEAKAAFLEKFAEAEAEAKQRLRSGYEQAGQAVGRPSGNNFRAGANSNSFGNTRPGPNGGSNYRPGAGSNSFGSSRPAPNGGNNYRAGTSGNGNGANNYRAGTSSNSFDSTRPSSGGSNKQFTSPVSQPSFGNSRPTFDGNTQQSTFSNSQPSFGINRASHQGGRQSAGSSSNQQYSATGGQQYSAGDRQQYSATGGQQYSAGDRQQYSATGGQQYSAAGGQQHSAGDRQQYSPAASQQSAVRRPGPARPGAPQNDRSGDVHPSMIVSDMALGGHMKKAPAARPAKLSNNYLPPN